MDAEIKREIMLDHYQHPYHQETQGDDYITANGNNVSCIDNINLFIKMENDLIKDAYFDGEACAISTSSTSIMLKNIIGKTINEAFAYIEAFEKMVNEEPFDQSFLGEAIVFDEIYKQANRKTCATLPYTALKKALTTASEANK